MSKTAKGKRPIYLDNPESDKLLAIILALMEEVSVLHERMDTVERLLEAKGLIAVADSETYEPDEKVALEREKWRQEYIARVLRILEEKK